MNDMNDKISLRDQVLATVPAASHPGILKMALDHQIADPNDPQWGMVALAWTSTEAANVSRASLESVRKEVATIPDSVYRGAAAAGADLRGLVETAGKSVIEIAAAQTKAMEQGLAAAVAQGVGVGAERLEKAVAALDRAIVSRRDATVAEWQAAAGKAAAAEAQKGIAARMARSWGIVVLSLLFAGAIGAGAALAGLYSAGLIAPKWLRVYRHPGADIMVIAGTAYSAIGCPPGATCIQVARPLR